MAILAVHHIHPNFISTHFYLVYPTVILSFYRSWLKPSLTKIIPRENLAHTQDYP